MVHPVMFSSASPEWYTPPEIAEPIAAFLGGLDLDPAARGSTAIPALRHEIVDGLAIDWYGRILLNPPYGRGVINKWINKTLEQRPNYDEIVLVLPARVGADWFHPLSDFTLCMLYNRIRFIPGEAIKERRRREGKSEATDSPAFDSCLAYIGPRPIAFMEHFSGYGWMHAGANAFDKRHDMPAAFALASLGLAGRQRLTPTPRGRRRKRAA